MAERLTYEMEQDIRLLVDEYLRSYTHELQDLKDDFEDSLLYLAILMVEATIRIRKRFEISPTEEIALNKEANEALADFRKKDANPFLVAKLFMDRWSPHWKVGKGG